MAEAKTDNTGVYLPFEDKIADLDQQIAGCDMNRPLGHHFEGQDNERTNRS